MFCYYCGNEISDDAKFCGKCGKSVVWDFGSEQQQSEAYASEKRRVILGIPSSGDTGGQNSLYGGSYDTGTQNSAYGGSYDTGAQNSPYGGSYNPGAQNPAYGGPYNPGAQNSPYGGSYNTGAQNSPYGGSYNTGAQSSPYGGSYNTGAQNSPYGGSYNPGAQNSPYGGPYNTGAQNGGIPQNTQAGNMSGAVPAVPVTASPSLPKHLANVGSADTGSGGLRDIYIVDFLVRLVTIKENIPLCIYLLMNVLFIGFICTMFTNGNIAIGMLVGLIVYAISITVSLSPLGEWLLRNRVGCVPITDPNIANRLNPIFNEVYGNAKRMNPNLPDDIKLFMNEDPSPNAFATGRRTVCITRGMLNRTDDQIKGTLGHEFGHLAHKDTDKILIISIGNTFVSAICILAQIGAFISELIASIMAIFMGRNGIFVILMAALSRFLTVTMIGLFFRVWTGIGNMLVMKTSRGNEYQADEYSTRLGYGAGLIGTLQSFGNSPKPQGLFAALASSHPDTQDRITRIRHLMATGQNH